MSNTSDIRDAAALGVKGPSSRGDYRVCCPFCTRKGMSPDTEYKLSVNPKGMFYCYRCGSKGGARLDWLGPVKEVRREKEERPVGIDPPYSFEPIDSKAISMRPYRRYFERRGVLEQATYVGAGACTSGRFRGRVVVPMKDDRGTWTGFSARTIGDGHPKYLYPAGMDRRGSLWGIEYVRRLKDRSLPAYLIEGVFDALPLFPQGLAAYGKNVTDAQLDLLVGLGRPIVVALDGDAWEEGRAVAARLRLRGVEDVSWSRLPPATDPGKLGFRVNDYAQKLTDHAQ